jgi:TonB family protein
VRHGIDGHQQELQDGARRAAVCITGVSLLALLAALALALDPRLQRAFEDPTRFGFEGPETFVRRIRLEDIGPRDTPGLSQVTVLRDAARGGGGTPRDDAGAEAARRRFRDPSGAGLDAEDLRSMTRAMLLDAPIVRSEELIAVHLARPEYPALALERDVEGDIEMLAMIDTLGRVLQVQVSGGVRDSTLERAAMLAAFQNRYRPYRVEGRAQTVWVPLKYTFTIDRGP